MMRELRRNYRRVIAFILTAVMTFTNIGTNLNVAFAAGGGGIREESSLFILDGSELLEAVQNAEENEEVFDFSSLNLKTDSKKTLNAYRELLKGTKSAPVYELDVEADSDYATPDTDLKVFYHSGEKKVVFLFINESDAIVNFCVDVDSYRTPEIEVKPNTANVELEGVDAGDTKDFSDAALRDDVKETLGAVVLNPTAEESGEAQEESSLEETSEMEETSEEQETGEAEETLESEEESAEESAEEAETPAEETVKESEQESEDTEETDAVLESERETETETEAEREAEQEEIPEEEPAADGELLGMSLHQVSRVGTSDIIPEEEATKEEAIVSEEETGESEEAEGETEESEESEEETPAAEEESKKSEEEIPVSEEETGFEEKKAGESEEQVLVDEELEACSGKLEGREYETVTIWDSVNAAAYAVKAEAFGQFAKEYETQSVEKNGVIIEVTWDTSQIPASAQLLVEEVTSEAMTQAVEAGISAGQVDGVDLNQVEVKDVIAYDITLMDGDQIYSTWEKGTVTVRFYGAPIEEKSAEADRISVLHLDEDTEEVTEVAAEELPEEETASEITFEPEHFSVYALAMLKSKSGGDAVAMIGSQPYATLQDALTAAAGAEEPVTITLVKDVTESVTSGGASFILDLDDHVITGAGGSVFNIEGGTVTLKDGTITGGGSGTKYGGGIYAKNAVVTIDNVLITKNILTSGYGGGIYVTSTELTIVDSKIRENASTGGGAGAIRAQSSSKVTIENSDISENTALSMTGGIVAAMDTTLSLKNVTMRNNTVEKSGNTASAIFVTWSSSVQAEQCIIERNGRTGTPAAAVKLGQQWGAVKATFTECKISSNNSEQGAVLVDGGSDLKLENCVVSGNHASATDKAAGAAGGICVLAGSLHMVGGAVYQNTCSGEKGNDLYIAANKVITIPAAADMTDSEAGMSFEGYVWYDDASDAVVDEALENNAVDAVRRFSVKEAPITGAVAVINEVEVDHAAWKNAVETAADGSEIKILQNFPMGDITLSGNVTMNLNGKSLKRGSIRIAEGGHVVFSGSGAVKGPVTNEGTLELRDPVAIDTIEHRGTSFTVAGDYETAGISLNTVLDAGKVIHVADGSEFRIASLRVALTEAAQKQLEQGASVVVVEGGCKRLFKNIAVTGSNYNLIAVPEDQNSTDDQVTNILVKPRNVAKNRNTNVWYDKLEDAIAEANPGDSIVLDPESNPSAGTEALRYNCSPVVIDKDLELEVAASKAITAADTETPLFTVKPGARLTLKGNGAVYGRVRNEGSLEITGNVGFDRLDARTGIEHAGEQFLITKTGSFTAKITLETGRFIDLQNSEAGLQGSVITISDEAASQVKDQNQEVLIVANCTEQKARLFMGSMTLWPNMINTGLAARNQGIYVSKLYQASIGEQKYLTLADALETAKDGDVITLIAGEDGAAKNEITCKTMEISKKLVIDLNGKGIVTESGPHFRITKGGELTLQGTGTLTLKNGSAVENEGTFALHGAVTMGAVDHRGSAFKAGAQVKDLNVRLGKGAIITAEEGFSPDNLTVELDKEVLDELNQDLSEKPESVAIMDGSVDQALADKIRFNPVIGNIQVVRTVQENQIILKKEKAEGVYLDGAHGSDEVDGLSLGTAVKTFAKAVEIAKGKNYDRIYVLGTVTVDVDSTFESPEGSKLTLYRYPSFTGTMVSVSKGVLSLENIVLDGARERGITNADSLIKVQSDAKLMIESGAVLQNNSIKDHTGGIPLGGAIDVRGNAVMNGGVIQNCESVLGGAVYCGEQNAESTFTMNGGVIRNNAAADGKGESAAGGAVMIGYKGSMYMNGGTVSGNSSECWGGGIAVGCKNGAFVKDNHPRFEMSGGSVTENVSADEGGGIFIQCNGKAEITGGSITNNETKCLHAAKEHNFGGGGIYVNGGLQQQGYENGFLKLSNVKVSGNYAAVAGGGLAGCGTSRSKIYLSSGSAIYGNSAGESAADVLISNILHSSGIPALGNKVPAYIAEYMLGGIPYLWKDERNEDADIRSLHDDGTIMLHNDHTDETAKKAVEKAAVLITGNISASRGGGIGSNGDVSIGDAPKPEEVVEITAQKTWDDAGFEKERPDSVKFWLVRQAADGKEERVAAAYVTRKQDGSWTTAVFDDQPKWDDDGRPYTYRVEEDEKSLGGRYESTVTQTPDHTWLITNTRVHGLRLEKQVENAKDPQQQYGFTIQLKQADGSAFSGTVQALGAAEEITFDKTGKAHISLKDDAYVVLKNLKHGMAYTIAEDSNDADSTTVSVNGGRKTAGLTAEGTSDQDMVEILFTNTYIKKEPTPEQPETPEKPEQPTKPGRPSGGGGRDHGSSDSGTRTITPDPIPMASVPESPDPTTVIEENEIPLAALPKTGRTSANALILFLSGIMFAAIAAATKKKEEEN